MKVFGRMGIPGPRPHFLFGNLLSFFRKVSINLFYFNIFIHRSFYLSYCVYPCKISLIYIYIYVNRFSDASIIIQQVNFLA